MYSRLRKPEKWEIRVLILYAIILDVAWADHDLLNPDLGSELAFRVRKRPSGWHVAAHVHETQVD